MNVLDLFSGACGGWTVGLEAAGFNTVAACEVIPWRRARYSYNFPHVKVYDDVRTLTAKRLKADGIPRIDVVAGSPPCQDASAANSVKGGQGIDGERTGLFWQAVRLVQELRPDWVCLENVPPLRTKGYDRIHDALAAAGYTCRPFVVEAALAGAPHLRARVWIVANAKVLQRTSIARNKSNGHSARPSASDAPDAEGRARWSRSDLAFPKSEIVCPTHDPVSASEQVGTGRQSWLDALEEWKSWNGGLARFDGMDDGIPKGMARELLSAYGDAVVPIIPEIIGRAILAA